MTSLTQDERILDLSSIAIGYSFARFGGARGGIRALFRIGTGQCTVLKDVNARIAFPTRITVLTGANGSGKTTLLRAIAGAAPFRGAISWCGIRLQSGNLRQRQALHIAYVPVDNATFPHLTVREHFLLWPTQRSKLVQRLEQFVAAAERVNSELHGQLGFLFSNKIAGNLSVGQKRILSLAQLLLHEWSLVILDEPRSGLSASWTSALSVLLDTLAPACVLEAEQQSQALEFSNRHPIYKLDQAGLNLSTKDVAK